MRLKTFVACVTEGDEILVVSYASYAPRRI